MTPMRATPSQLRCLRRPGEVFNDCGNTRDFRRMRLSLLAGGTVVAAGGNDNRAMPVTRRARSQMLCWRAAATAAPLGQITQPYARTKQSDILFGATDKITSPGDRARLGQRHDPPDRTGQMVTALEEVRTCGFGFSAVAAQIPQAHRYLIIILPAAG